jgi:hypothetical protein
MDITNLNQHKITVEHRTLYMNRVFHLFVTDTYRFQFVVVILLFIFKNNRDEFIKRAEEERQKREVTRIYGMYFAVR